MRDFGVVDGKLTAGNGPKTVLNSVQLLSSIFKHARRFKWIPTNPYKDVRKPRFKVKVRAFTAAEVATLAHHADESTALLILSMANYMDASRMARFSWRDDRQIRLQVYIRPVDAGQSLRALMDFADPRLILLESSKLDSPYRLGGSRLTCLPSHGVNPAQPFSVYPLLKFVYRSCVDQP